MRILVSAIALFGFMVASPAHAVGPLELAEAESLIAGADPAFARFETEAGALDEGAVAAGQLPDPRLRVGVINLPMDTYEFDQEPMTQAVVGLSQAFPAGRTLSLKDAQTKDMAAKKRAAGAGRALEARLAVRLAWLEGHYWSRAIEILEESAASLRNVVGAMASRFATGVKRSEDLVRTELELSIVEDRALEAERMLGEARAQLSRWIGTHAQRPLGTRLPEMSPPGDLEDLKSALARHPAARELNAEIAVRRRDIDLARQRYWPEFSIEAAYGYREQDRTGRDLPDFASLMVNLSLPLFFWDRQDRQVERSRLEADSARHVRDERLLELARMLEQAWSDWLRLGQRLALYERALADQSAQNLELAMLGYQVDVTDFATLMRAQLTEIDIRLKELRVRVDRAKAQARLSYLKGILE
jgi:outer membrane protein TolC